MSTAAFYRGTVPARCIAGRTRAGERGQDGGGGDGDAADSERERKSSITLVGAPPAVSSRGKRWRLQAQLSVREKMSPSQDK